MRNKLMKLCFNNGGRYKPKGQDMTFMSQMKFGKTGPLSLHFGVFMSTLRSQCSHEQQDWWLTRAQRLGLIGCYAQTELGHGAGFLTSPARALACP